MTKFADQLFDDLMREHGTVLSDVRVPSAPRRRHTARPALLAAGAGGVAAAVTRRSSELRIEIDVDGARHVTGPVSEDSPRGWASTLEKSSMKPATPARKSQRLSTRGRW